MCSDRTEKETILIENEIACLISGALFSFMTNNKAKEEKDED